MGTANEAMSLTSKHPVKVVLISEVWQVLQTDMDDRKTAPAGPLQIARNGLIHVWHMISGSPQPRASPGGQLSVLSCPRIA